MYDIVTSNKEPTMNITFNFDRDTFEVEANPPTSEYDIIDILIPRLPKLKKVEGKILPRFEKQEPEKVWGKQTLHPVTFTFNTKTQPRLHKLMHERMVKQQTLFTDESAIPLASEYKFDARLSNDDDRWNLHGCFLSCVELDEDMQTVELSVDHIPNVKVIRKECEREMLSARGIDVTHVDWVD